MSGNRCVGGGDCMLLASLIGSSSNADGGVSEVDVVMLSWPSSSLRFWLREFVLS